MILTVNYDCENRIIHIPVRVNPDLQVSTPPVAIPKSTNPYWKLSWELDTESAKIASLDEVKKTDPTAMVRFDLQFLEKGTNYYRALATSSAQMTDANCLSLDLCFTNKRNGGKFTHDPTIAVTLDPVDGMSYGAPNADAVLALND